MGFDDVYEQIVAASGSSTDYHSIIKPRIAYLWDKVSHLISPDSVVVEIGVGPTVAIVRKLTGAIVIGIDHVDYQQGLCDKFGVELRMCDLQRESIPLDDESVDIIFFLEVIEHLCVYPECVLDEIYKKLKRGGYLILSTVNILRISNRIRVLMGKSPLINYFEKSKDGHNHIREFVPDEMSYYMKKSGFSIQEVYQHGIPISGAIISMLLRLAYLYPGLRNYFIIIGRK